MNKKKSSEAPKLGAAIVPVNLVIDPVEIQPIATLTLQPILTGGPIMREGFITDTGLMVAPSSNSPTNLAAF